MVIKFDGYMTVDFAPDPSSKCPDAQVWGGERGTYIGPLYLSNEFLRKK